MLTYIVAFQVDDAERKSGLKERIKSYGTYCPINENCWAVYTDKTHTEVRDHLDEILDDSDRIFVIRSGTAAAWRNAYSKQNSDWLKEYLQHG